MSTDAEADFVRAVTFHPSEAEELWWVVSQLEDWLLHASDEAVAALGDFVNHHHPSAAVAHVIDALGAYGVELRRRSRGQDR